MQLDHVRRNAREHASVDRAEARVGVDVRLNVFEELLYDLGPLEV